MRSSITEPHSLSSPSCRIRLGLEWLDSKRIRFGSVIDNIRKHYEDTKISVYRDEEDIETGFNLYDILFWLSKIKKDGELKDAKLPCKIKKDMLDAILTGTPYPSNVLQYAVHRIARDHEIVPNRIAIIKGCL